jgi:pimeloyl-ACP methyl ester carboxylesterase
VRLRRLIWFGAGAAVGAYLIDKRRRNLAAEPRPLRDASGRALSPRIVQLAGGECVPVIDAGDGPTVVLIPGLSGDSQVFRHQVAALSGRFRVIAPNLRSEFDGVEPRFDQFAHDIVTVLDECNVPSACVVGLSFGCPIAVRLASLYRDRVWGLVLTNGLLRLDLSHVGLNRTLLIPVARFLTRFAPASLVRQLGRLWGRLRVWVFDPSPGNERIIDYELEAPLRFPLAISGVRMATFKDCDLRSDLHRLRQPALMIVGAVDTYTPIEWQREIAELLPNCTYVEIPDGGHLTLISHADTFNEVVLDWLHEQQDLERLARRSLSAETA